MQMAEHAYEMLALVADGAYVWLAAWLTGIRSLVVVRKSIDSCAD
jgi:hypothetical protein